jgi:hypothetical protein
MLGDRITSRKFWLGVGSLAVTQTMVCGAFNVFSGLLQKGLISDVIYERIVSALMFNDAVFVAGVIGLYFGVNLGQNFVVNRGGNNGSGDNN